MAISYEAPGVYVEEIPPLARPIAGVGTSTAAFIGVADRLAVGDVGKPKKFTSWGEFSTFIKGAGATDTTPIYTTANRTLALAVFGFFNNGGTACYVLPVGAVGDLATLGTELEAFEPIDEIAIVAAPGIDDAVRKAELLDHCFKLQDRVAVLDGVKSPASDSTPGRHLRRGDADRRSDDARQVQLRGDLLPLAQGVQPAVDGRGRRAEVHRSASERTRRRHLGARGRDARRPQGAGQRRASSASWIWSGRSPRTSRRA